MAINERLVHTASAAAAAGTGNQEEGLVLHLDANDVDSYDGDGNVWYDIKDHEYTPATDVSEHFNTVTYTGSASPHIVDTVGFQPDLIWIKNRDTSDSYAIVDSVRGIVSPAPYIASDLTAGQSTSTNMPTSVQSNGFTITGNGGRTNTIGEDYVAWCFKAGGAAVPNPDGSVNSQVSVNNDLGFSVIKYTGTNSSSNFGHGLDTAPELYLIKPLDRVGSWGAYSTATSGLTFGYLNQTSAFTSSALAPPTGSLIYVDNSEGMGTNYLTGDYICYAFTSKRGVSKVGSYVGNGSTTGPIVTLGFEPAWLMFKCTTQPGNWIIIDNKRATSNPRTPHLRANSNSADDFGANEYVDFTSTGFQPKGVSNYNNNSSGQTYIYYAVAKNTNETSLIPDTDLELHLDADSFDGSTNTPATWTDKTYNGNNGTITGATFDAELGDYLNITSDSTYIDVPTANMLDSDFTIEMWYNISSTSSSYKMLLGGSNYQDQTGLGHYVYGDTIKTWISVSGATSNVMTSPSVITANKWQHIVLKREGSTWTQYIDGEQVHTVTGSTASISSPNSRIGRHYNSTGLSASGKSGQVRIYSSALTQAQIRQNFNFTKPSYPNGYDGTISGASWNPGGYFNFDGINDYVSINHSKFYNNFSVSLWAYFDSVTPGSGESKKLFCKSTFYASSHTAFPFSIEISTTGVLSAFLSYGNDYTPDVTVSGSVTAAKWHHIAVTAEKADKLQLWITPFDGTFNTTPTSNAPYTGTVTDGANNNYTIGRAGAEYGGGVNKSYMDGRVSKVKMYDKVITASEISSLFNEGY